MAKSKWITNPNELPVQPNENIPVSDTVIIKTSSGRKTIGYYDFSRQVWYITGVMTGEKVEGWQYFPA